MFLSYPPILYLFITFPRSQFTLSFTHCPLDVSAIKKSCNFGAWLQMQLAFNPSGTSPLLAAVKKQVHTLLCSNLLPLPDNPNIMTLDPTIICRESFSFFISAATQRHFSQPQSVSWWCRECRGQVTNQSQRQNEKSLSALVISRRIDCAGLAPCRGRRALGDT